MRTPNPVASVTLPERCYTMDSVDKLLVVGTAEKHVQIFHLNTPTQAIKVSFEILVLYLSLCLPLLRQLHPH
jgi:hypothetical protein